MMMQLDAIDPLLIIDQRSTILSSYTWSEIRNFNKDIGAVREYLREGDCTDMTRNSDGDSGSYRDSGSYHVKSSHKLLDHKMLLLYLLLILKTTVE